MMRFAAIGILATVVAGAAQAGEIVGERPADRLEWDVPRARNECTVQYYNVCTAQAWQWSGWEDGDRTAVVFDACAPGAQLVETLLYSSGELPSGYGYTGNLSVHPVDADLVPFGPPIAQQAFLPLDNWGGGWVTASWGGLPVPDRFALVYEHAWSGAGHWLNVLELWSDHPAPAGTGPPACGTCYPADRESRTFDLGPADAPHDPPIRFNDYVCDVEFFWKAVYDVTTAVEQQSWGRVKALYH